MENLKTELDALLAIEGTPVPPINVAGLRCDDNGMVTLPPRIKSYLEEINDLPQMDKEGKIHYKKYFEILKDLNIKTLGHPVIKFVIVNPKTYKDSRDNY